MARETSVLNAGTGMLTLPDDAMPRVVLVIDASETAREDAAIAGSLVGNLLRSLPRTAVRVIHFLGSAADHRPTAWRTHSPRWLQDNAGRLSVIGPVWRMYEEDETSIFVVVATGPIYDLPDWRASSLMRRTYFVDASGNGAPAVSQANGVAVHGIEDIVRIISDPTVEASISGSGFLPTWWDNSAYRIRLTDGVSLVAAEGAKPYSVKVSFLAADIGGVECVLTRRSGHHSSMPLSPTAAPAARDPIRLSDDEAQVWRAIVAGVPFTCPACGDEHRRLKVRCRRQGDVKTRPIFSSLRDLEGTFVIFSDDGDGVRCSTPSSPVLALGTSALVKDQDGNLVLLEYDHYNGWHRGQDPDPLYALGKGRHAVWL